MSLALRRRVIMLAPNRLVGSRNGRSSHVDTGDRQSRRACAIELSPPTHLLSGNSSMVASKCRRPIAIQPDLGKAERPVSRSRVLVDLIGKYSSGCSDQWTYCSILQQKLFASLQMLRLVCLAHSQKWPLLDDPSISQLFCWEDTCLERIDIYIPDLGDVEL